jgi:hypothetical protein
VEIVFTENKVRHPNTPRTTTTGNPSLHKTHLAGSSALKASQG